MHVDGLRRHRRVAAVVAVVALIGVFIPGMDVIVEAVMFAVSVAAIGYVLILTLRIRRKRREAEHPSTARTERPVWNVLAFALVPACFDVFVAGQGIWSFLLVAVALGYYAPKALFAWRNRPVMTVRLQKGALVLAIGVGAAVLVQQESQRETQRAAAVVKAVQQYKMARGTYPPTLQALVPQFLPQLPERGVVMLRPPLNYVFNGPESARLWYVALPPFGRNVFNFESAKWTQID